MASWLFSIMLLLVDWQQRICFAAAGSESITLLVQKYSGSTGLITIDQMQQIIDRIRNCSSDDSNIDTGHSLQRNCASNQDCGYINNVTFFILYPINAKHQPSITLHLDCISHYLLNIFITVGATYTY